MSPTSSNFTLTSLLTIIILILILALLFTHDNSLCMKDDIDSKSDSPSRAFARFNWHDNIDLLDHKHICITGSSNGLVCLRIARGNRYYYIICNPLTREFKLVTLPVEILSIAYQMGFGLDGFGYDSQHDDYKVVHAVRSSHHDIETWVYSLNTDSWRKAPDQHKLPGLCVLRCALVFGHGMVHCILRREYSFGDYANDDVQAQIARFNLSSEKWEDDGDLGYPIHPTSLHNVNLTFLDGHLCLSITMHSEGVVDIWIMKEYGVKESWTKLLHVLSLSMTRPIAYSRTTPGLLWLYCANRHGGIVCYDTKHGTITEESKFNIAKKFLPVYVCVPSLVRIPGSSHMRGETHHVDNTAYEEEDNTVVSSSNTLSVPVPPKKEKKKGKKRLLYYSWSRTF